MKIYIQMKSIGKKRPVLEKTPYLISDQIHTVKEFLCEITRTETARFNQKETDRPLVPFLSPDQIKEQASVGKVGFGAVYSEKKADPDKACENACLCYGDGLVRVFQNGTEIGGLQDSMQIQENDEFTFIRLTFLAGRMW